MTLPNSKTKMLEDWATARQFFAAIESVQFTESLLQIPETAQWFLRMNNVAATFATRANDPTPAILGNGAGIIPRPAGSGKLVSDQFPLSHGRHDARIS
jgi:hypothetical protein